jgi:hypothetical protein
MHSVSAAAQAAQQQHPSLQASVLRLTMQADYVACCRVFDRSERSFGNVQVVQHSKLAASRCAVCGRHLQR